MEVRTIYPSCSLCRGKGEIDIEGVIKIKCPACHYDTWTPTDDVKVLLDDHSANRVRMGYPIQVKYQGIKWKAHNKKS